MNGNGQAGPLLARRIRKTLARLDSLKIDRRIVGQGRGVFAISLTLPAAKENRNGSCRTLPAYCTNSR